MVRGIRPPIMGFAADIVWKWADGYKRKGRNVTGFSGNVGYTLFWPAESLDKEIELLIQRANAAWSNKEWVRDACTLLGQAFTSQAPANDFRDIARNPDLFDEYSDGDPCVLWLRDLARAGRNHSLGPRPYYSKRQHDDPDARTPTDETAVQVSSLVKRLFSEGYFCMTFGENCYEVEDVWMPTPQHELERLVGKPDLWTSDPNRWDDADLFDFIEVFHDLVARPTNSFWCEPCLAHHWHEFCQDSGQRVYRDLVNQLLDKSGIELRIAETGEDIGRMVQAVPDDMRELFHEALDRRSPDQNEKRHAIATFRHRDGTVEQRRSAIVALAGILENRKKLLKSELLTKDENALFNIANNFNLRHNNANQQNDYAPEFLDWIFYWYLATINLTDQLMTNAAEPEFAVDEEPF